MTLIIPQSTATPATHIRPLAGVTKVYNWDAGELGVFRFGVTRRTTIDSAALQRIDEDALGKRPGRGKMSDCYNKFFWVRQTDDRTFELKFDHQAVEIATPMDLTSYDPVYYARRGGWEYPSPLALYVGGIPGDLLNAVKRYKLFRGQWSAPVSNTMGPIGRRTFHGDSHWIHAVGEWDAGVVLGMTYDGSTPFVYGPDTRGNTYVTDEGYSGAVQLHSFSKWGYYGAEGAQLNAAVDSWGLGREGEPDLVLHCPGGSGWVPMLGLRAHGVHPSIDYVKLVDGVVTEVRMATTGVSIAAALREWKPFVAASDVPSLEATANDIQASVGVSNVAVLYRRDKFGPFDVYDCRQVAKARSDGASLGDIDDTMVAGKRAAVWRAEGLKRPAVNLAAWVAKGSGYALPVVRASRSNGVLAVDPTPSPGIAVLLAPPSFGTGGSQFASADSMLALVQQAYPDTEFYLDRDDTDDVVAMGNAFSAVQGDMPYVWWQSAGLSGMAGVLKSVLLAGFLPK